MVPRVSVSISLRRPMMPRLGTRNSMRTRPEPWLCILVISPLRGPSFSMTTPVYSSGTSMVTCSTGSMRTPSTVLVTISGRPTLSSKPSRRIISIRTPSCISPRPSTLKLSGESVSSTRMETLVSSSRSRRSRRLRLVTSEPSLPQKGELLTENCMAIVGSSMTISGSGAGFSRLVMVSPMVMPSTPAMATMSPISVVEVSVRLRPAKVNSLVMRVFCSERSRREMATSSPTFSVPWKTRAIAMRPKYSE